MRKNSRLTVGIIVDSTSRMNADSLLNQDWSRIVSSLGGATALDAAARQSRAFLRPRGIRSPVELLRLIFAYCLGERGLRATAA